MTVAQIPAAGRPEGDDGDVVGRRRDRDGAGRRQRWRRCGAGLGAAAAEEEESTAGGERCGSVHTA